MKAVIVFLVFLAGIFSVRGGLLDEHEKPDGWPLDLPECRPGEVHRISIRLEPRTLDVILTIALFATMDQQIVWSADNLGWVSISGVIHQASNSPALQNFEYRIPREVIQGEGGPAGFFEYAQWHTNNSPCVYRKAGSPFSGKGLGASPLGSGNGPGSPAGPSGPTAPPVYNPNVTVGADGETPNGTPEGEVTGAIAPYIRQVKRFSTIRLAVEGGGQPLYQSGGIETNSWEGDIQFPPGQSGSLWAHSDDGVTFFINDSMVVNNVGRPQNYRNSQDSFWFLGCVSGSNHVRLVYSNVIKGAKGDNDDGFTVFLLPHNGVVLSGRDAFPSYGTQEEDAVAIYQIETHADWVAWEVSGNLTIVETNIPLKYIKVRGLGPSAATGSDFVGVSFFQCGQLKFARMPVTVLTPRQAKFVAALDTSANAREVVTQAGFTVVDQFAREWRYESFVSEFSWHASGGVQAYIPWPDQKDIQVNPENGFFIDYVRGPRTFPPGAPVVRNQGWTIRCITGGNHWGRLIYGGRIIYDVPIVISPARRP